MFAPGYKTPRSLQMNVGIQREIRRGMVFSADYLRNVGTRSLLSIDQNHEGDVKNFNPSAAVAAINETNASFGCRTGNRWSGLRHCGWCLDVGFRWLWLAKFHQHWRSCLSLSI